MRIEISSSGFGGAAVSELQKNFTAYMADTEGIISSFKAVRENTFGLNGGAGNLQGAADNVGARISVEEEKLQEAKNAKSKLDDFVALTARTDEAVSEKVNKNKNEFYRVNAWLKPALAIEAEVPWYEAAWNWLRGAGETVVGGAKQAWDWVSDTAAKAWNGITAFYQEHKKVIDTVLIVVGAAMAVAAVVGSGGLALAPLLGTGLAAVGGIFGMSAATAAAAATTVSTIVAFVAVGSTIGAAGMNIADTWMEIDNPTFHSVRKALNITSTITNLAYSIGNIYNSIKGVTPKEYLARQRALEGGKYKKLDAEHPRMKHSNAAYDDARKKAIYEANMEWNNGELRSDRTGKILPKPKRSEYAVSPPPNEAQIDHIYPRAKGGLNSFENAQVIEREANRHKSDLLDFTDYEKYSLPDLPNWKNFFKNIFEGGAAVSQTAPRTGDDR